MDDINLIIAAAGLDIFLPGNVIIPALSTGKKLAKETIPSLSRSKSSIANLGPTDTPIP